MLLAYPLAFVVMMLMETQAGSANEGEGAEEKKACFDAKLIILTVRF